MHYNPVVLATSVSSALAAVSMHDGYTMMSSIDELHSAERVTIIPFKESVADVLYCGMVQKGENRKNILWFLQECRRITDLKLTDPKC